MIQRYEYDDDTRIYEERDDGRYVLYDDANKVISGYADHVAMLIERIKELEDQIEGMNNTAWETSE